MKYEKYIFQMTVQNENTSERADLFLPEQEDTLAEKIAPVGLSTQVIKCTKRPVKK